MGDHPEDEDDFYEDEMDVRISPAPGGGEMAGGHKRCWVTSKTKVERKHRVVGLRV